MVGHAEGMRFADDCVICRGRDGDRELGRVQAWEDGLWRVTVSLSAPVVGFSYLERKRQIPYITELDGVEATTLGPVLARVTRVLAEETGAEQVYVNGQPPPQPEQTLRTVADQLARRLRD